MRLYAQRVIPTRHAATVALLLAGAHTSKAGYITTTDLDVDAGTVNVRESARYRARTLSLDGWARRVLADRTEHLTRRQRSSAEAPVLCAAGGGSRASRQAGVCAAAREILTRAGLSTDPAMRPLSLTGHAGRRVFDQTGHIEDAARLLGSTSLDTVATLIGHHWQPGKPG